MFSKNRNKIKNENGITLMILVITIIVLLILATVTITNVTKKDGMIESVEGQKSEMLEMSAKQEIEVAAEKVKLANASNKELPVENFTEELENKLKAKDTDAKVEPTIIGYDATINGYTFSYFYDTDINDLIKITYSPLIDYTKIGSAKITTPVPNATIYYTIFDGSLKENITETQIENASWIEYPNHTVDIRNNGTIFAKIEVSGNSSNYAYKEVKNIDNLDPTITNANADNTVYEKVTFTASIEDATKTNLSLSSGIKTINLYIDGVVANTVSNPSTSSFSYTKNNLSIGSTHKWYIEAIDKADNRTTTEEAEIVVLGETELKVKYYFENIEDNNYTLASSNYTKNVCFGNEITLENYKNKISYDDKAFTYSYGSLIDSTQGASTEEKITKTNMGLNTTICLYYSRNIYTVTLAKDDNIADVSGGNDYKVGASVTVSATPKTETGYTIEFTNWTGTYTSTDNPYTFEMPTNDVSLTANGTKTINQYTVTCIDKSTSEIELGRSTWQADYGTTAYGRTKGTDTTTGTYYTGYYYSSDTNAVVGTSGCTVYRIFTPQSYTITYNLDGGSVATANLESYTIETDTFTLNNPTKTGYTFAGWTGTGLSSVSISVSIAKGSTGNRSYTATWTINQYTVTCIDKVKSIDGAELGRSTWQANYGTTAYGRTAGNNTTTGTYYTGYYYSSDTNAVVGTSGCTVYRIFTPQLYAQSNRFYKAHPIYSWQHFDTKTYYVEYGSYYTCTYADVTTPTGYHWGYFNSEGWTVERDRCDDLGNGHYLPNTYTLSFNANGGSCGTPNKVVTYDYYYGDLPTAERTGYTFTGWFTDSNGGTQITSSNVYQIAGDSTLYAHWTLNAPSTPSIQSENASVNIFDNTTTTFTATFTAAAATYQWYYGSTAVSGASGSIDGTSTVTLNIPTTSMNNSNYAGGTYTIKVTNAAGESNASAVQTVTYTIGGPTQLANFPIRVNNQGIVFSSKTVTLTTSIVLGGTNNWTPIGNDTISFGGTFNAQGNSISGININGLSKINQGLFGANAGTIQNVTVSGNIKGANNTAGIAGSNTGTIINCRNQVTITSNNNSAGGIAGDNKGTVEKCVNNATITNTRGASAPTGGIVGWNFATIQYCYNTAEITGTGNTTCIGGIAGLNFDANARIINCFDIGNASGYSHVGRIVGANKHPDPNLSTTYGVLDHNYYEDKNNNITGIGDQADAQLKTEKQPKSTIQSDGFLAWIGGTGIWKRNGGYPMLIWE